MNRRGLGMRGARRVRPAGRTAAWLALGLLAACAAAPRGASGAVADQPPSDRAAGALSQTSARGPSRAPLSRGDGLVRVRLERWLAAPRLEIRGAREGPLVITQRSGQLAVDGKARAGELRLEPQAQVLWIGTEAFAGPLTFQAAAEGGFRVLHELELERYVEGVVAAELVLWNAAGALLEAQAIAARSYALRALVRRSELFGDVRDQAFAGSYVLGPGTKSAGAQRVASRLAQAVERTRGKVLTYQDGVLDARFHAACGGHTSAGAAIFPEIQGPELPGVACPPCQALGPSHVDLAWKSTLPRAALLRAAQAVGLGGALERLELVDADAGGRWRALELSAAGRSVRLSFERWRELTGRAAVPSASVTRTWPRLGAPIDGGLYLEGKGRGHGVGLCQLGARELAELGWSAERILRHYYPSARLAQLEDAR